MIQRLFPRAGLAALLLMSCHANAAVISLSPSTANAGPGDSISLDLTIDGLNDGGADSLGGFDIDIAYSTANLSLDGFGVGGLLGDPALGEAVDFSFGDLGGGFVNVSVLSLLEASAVGCVFCIPPFLDDLQPASFTLATFDFKVVALAPDASTTVSVDRVILSDAFAGPLAVDATHDATISNPTLVVVAEPSPMALIAAGGVLLALVSGSVGVRRPARSGRVRAMRALA